MLCAKEMNIPQVSEYMEQMGITDDDIEQMSDQMMELMDGDGFEMGGAGTLPPYIQNLLNGQLGDIKKNESGDSNPPAARKSKQGSAKAEDTKKKKKKELKFLDNYCTNLSKKAEDGELEAPCPAMPIWHRVITCGVGNMTGHGVQCGELHHGPHNRHGVTRETSQVTS